jgi:hypothetical protein
MHRMLYYTATIITLDGSDTNAYGEACEPGHGYTEQHGWWNPDQDHWSVHPDRGQAQPDIYSPSSGAAPAHWLASQLSDRLGPIDHFDGERTFYSAREATWPYDPAGPVTSEAVPAVLTKHVVTDWQPRANPATVKTLTAAGHAHGFTDQEILDAASLLDAAERDSTWQQIRAAATDVVRAARLTAPQPESPIPVRGFVALGRAGDPFTLPGVPDLAPPPYEPGAYRGRSR